MVGFFETFLSSMKEKIVFIGFLVVFLTSSSVVAQDKLEYVKSIDPLIASIEHKENEEYQKAIEELDKIYEGDSLFFRVALSEKMSCYILLENYEKVKELGDKYWSFRHKLPTEFYLTYGSALDNLEEFDAAQNMYRSILKEYPTNYSIWYNYGVSLSLAKKYEEAFTAFQQTILINPRYDRVHLTLANLAFNEKQTTKGLMAMGMHLLLSVDKRNNFPQLRYGDYMSRTKYWNDEDFEGSSGFDFGGNNSFTAIDQLVHNYIALDKKYKAPTKMDFPLVKQLHLICSQLESMKVDEDDFWHKTYVSFYKDLLEDKQFEGFSYWISQFIENEKMSKVAKKKENDAIETYNWAVTTIDEKYNELDLEFIGYDIEKIERNRKYGYISILGDFEIIEGGNISGSFVSYTSEGRKKSEGAFNSNGEREGLWKFYYANGYLNEYNVFDNGVLTDTAAFYLENGLLSYEVSYKEGKIDGAVKVYNNGVLSRILPYSEGKMTEGLFQQFHPVETIDYSYTLKDGKAHGEYESYFASGELYRKGSYKEDELDGERLTYFRNGQLSTKENFVEGILEGEYISYYYNGKLEEEGSFKEGKKIGVWKSYYFEGGPKTIQEFGEDGKETGLETSYTEDGWKLSELVYKNGEIIAYKYFDKEGNVLSEDKRKGGDFYFKAYNEYGILIREGVYGKKDANGLWKYYYANSGVLKEEKSFKDGVSTGTYKKYFLNGDLETTYEYNEEGNYDGYFQEYFRNGKFYRQGYLNNGETDGPWQNYYRDGSLSKSSFYINGELEGFVRYYSVSNLPKSAEFYEEDLHLFTVYYDTSGVPFDTVYKTPGKRVFELRFCQDCPLFMSVEILNNRYHGVQKFYYPNDKLYSTGNYFNGNRHGEWIGYHENGKVKYKGSYEHGNKVGKWEYFYENGEMSEKMNYENDEIHGERISYDENGAVDFKANYFFGKMHGTAYYYIGGKNDHQREYYYDDLVEYSYTKNGKQVVVPVEKETATIEVYWNNGKLARKFDMKNGWYEGKYEKYFMSGKPAGEYTYQKGWQEGKNVLYYENGKVKEEYMYENGLVEGEALLYYSSGQLKEKRVYKLGELHGKVEKFDEKGNLLKVLYYYDNELVGIE